ncbi:MAG: Heat shock protein [Elusimicrobia bacterium]|nr:MAG: Heat shock protein [Elusimicrobiota bacterium]KAF0155240.1 MAG: Heat shock protein [Elusimicrobiota bacterium]
MKFAKRMVLFVLLNILIITTLSITMQLLGVRPYLDAKGIDYTTLLIFCLIWGMGGAFISLGLSRVMAKWMMGVKVIDPNTTNPELSRLVASVHNLAKAAGLPRMPEVGVYDSPEVNAFATGPTRSRALVAVSAGLLDSMDWEQVEGVLGHEIAHVANGDMVTMTLLQGVINAIVMFLARVIAFFIFRNSRDGGGGMQHLVVIVLQIALSFLGMILLAAFSRYREYRADAGGAGLAGREKMINALEGLRRTVKYADLTGRESVAAFKISSRPGGFAMLFSTHPPLEERIARLKAGA